MPRTVTARKPTAAELRRLQDLMEAEAPPLQQRRAQVLILHAAGLNVQDIARTLAVHPNTAYAALRAFRQQGLTAIERPAPRGTPVRLEPAIVQQVLRLADRPPYELGLPYGRWSLATLRDYLLKHRILRRVSRERLRQLLKKGASACGASNAN
jgi:transposase